jgi:hypothetical protein
MQPSRRHCLFASLALLALSTLAPRTHAETLAVTSSPPSAAQSSEMTNEDVLDMTKAGLSAGVIVEKISNTPCRFDTSVSALEALKSSGVENSVLSAMIRCHASGPAHTHPYVWIGANQERLSERSGMAITGRDSDDGISVETNPTKTTTQTHSEYADTARELSTKCPFLVITNRRSEADYAITIERYHSGHLMSQRNSFSVFRVRDGNLVLSDKTTWLKNAADDICRVISQDAAPNTAGGR